MVYNYTSSNRVIAKILRDTGINGNDYINDIIEWIGEALDFIGTQRQLVGKTRIIKTSSFRAPIPSDLYSLESIRYASGNYNNSPSIDDFKYDLEESDADYNSSFYNKQKSNQSGLNNGYIIDGNYIKTDLEESWIAITYWAFPLDNEGFPLIPDMVEFTEAITWYVMQKILLSGVNHPVINYELAHNQWLKYCTQARNQANMPDKGAYKAFESKWVDMLSRHTKNEYRIPDYKTAENIITNSFENKLKGN